MPLQLPTDLEDLVQERLLGGAYANAEEVIRLALEAQEAEDIWTGEERLALDMKIGRALELVASGRTFNPEEARQKLSLMRDVHLTKLSR